MKSTFLILWLFLPIEISEYKVFFFHSNETL